MHVIPYHLPVKLPPIKLDKNDKNIAVEKNLCFASS